MDDKELTEWAKQIVEHTDEERSDLLRHFHDISDYVAGCARCEKICILIKNKRQPITVPQRTINSLIYWQEKDGHNFRGALIDILAELGIEVEND